MKTPPDKRELHRLYWDEQLPQDRIAQMYGVSIASVSRWMKRYDIPVRTIHQRMGEFWASGAGRRGRPWTETERAAHMAYRKSPEYREKLSVAQRGEKAHNWKGGVEKRVPLGWNWREIRRQCYERDGWLCRDCGVHCTKRGKTKIQAHHVIPRRLGGGDELENLVTLCASCHQKRERRFADALFA